MAKKPCSKALKQVEAFRHEASRRNIRTTTNGASFVRHAYFLGANDPYEALKTEINEDARSSLHSDTSRPFEKPKSGRIAVTVINHLGDEVMKLLRVE